MNDRQTIGVVGYGFVGEAVAKGFAPTVDVLVYDKVKGRLYFDKGDVEPRQVNPSLIGEGEDHLQVLVEHCSIIFVCVPTPMRPDGSCDTSIVEGVLRELDRANVEGSDWDRMDRSLVVIKSTVPPSTTDRLQAECEWLELVYNPEFLTEANYLDDFAGQDRVIVGCHDSLIANTLATLYRRAFSNVPVWITTPLVAEMVKYMANCYLAVKVSYANEVKMICDELGCDYDEVVRLATLDERLGKSHWRVPGPDGQRGFGGSCFPKDLNAFKRLCLESGVDCPTMNGAWQTNLRVRPEWDWERLKGRAVVDNNSKENEND